MTITIKCPPMPISFNPNLLSTPKWGFKVESLYEISFYLQKKIVSNEFRRFPATIEKLKKQQQQFMELYERIKTQEREGKEKTPNKTHWIGYRPKLPNQNDQRAFERLNNRVQTRK